MRVVAIVVCALALGCSEQPAPSQPDAAPLDCGERPAECVDACDPDGSYCDAPSFECTCERGTWRQSVCAFPVPDCNVLSQAGCCDGEKCSFILDDLASGLGHTGCVAAGDAGLGELCEKASELNTSDTCAAGGSCYDGVCSAICSTAQPSCAAETSCTPINGLDYAVCLPTCDPVAQDCPGDLGCYVVADAAICAGVFEPAKAIGEPCTAANECTPGAGCFGEQGICRAFCNNTATCADGDTCTPLPGTSGFSICL